MIKNNKKLLLFFSKGLVSLSYPNYVSKNIMISWINSKATDLLIKSKDNEFSSKSYRNTSYEKKKRFIISLIHTV